MKPPDQKRLLSSPEDWISHAVSDLNLARLAQGADDIRAEQICFHAQQTVEKALKAVLLFSKVDFPLTHDLDQLVEIAEGAGIDIPEDIREAGILTPYAVEIHYPGYLEEITEQDVDAAVKLAKRVLSWAADFIAKK